jgi:hypothetical protein
MCKKVVGSVPVKEPYSISFLSGLLTGLLISECLAAPIFAAPGNVQQLGECRESENFYETHLYKVRRITIQTINLTNPLELLF